jgi:type II secretory pathway pseudopilin PulG
MIAKKNKGFTLLESIVVSGLFFVAILIVSQLFFNLTRSIILAQDMQLALDNIRFGTEKIWNEIKNGYNSTSPIDSSTINYLDRNCNQITIKKEGNNLIYVMNGNTTTVFDDNLVDLKKFEVYSDNPVSADPDPKYYKISNKIIVIYYEFDLKTKITKIPFILKQTVAPLNSIFPNNPCL